jgi:hypothetical protein
MRGWSATEPVERKYEIAQTKSKNGTIAKKLVTTKIVIELNDEKFKNWSALGQQFSISALPMSSVS